MDPDHVEPLLTDAAVDQLRRTRSCVLHLAYLLIAGVALSIWTWSILPAPANDPPRNPWKQFDERNDARGAKQNETAAGVPPGIIVLVVLGVLVFGFIVPLVALSLYSNSLGGAIRTRTRAAWREALGLQRFFWIIYALLTWAAVIILAISTLGNLVSQRL